MSQGDTTHQEVHARRGSDDLATIGLTRFDVAGIRFLDGESGANPTGGQESDDDTDSEQESDAADAQGADGDDTEDDDDDEGFDGEFDAKRARRTIDRLRRERNAARKKAAEGTENSPESKALKAENMRLKVALSTGLDADLADRLRGDTEDELLEDAQKLLDRFYPENKKPEPRQPKPAPRGGARPGADPELTADDVVKAALAR